MPRAPSTPRSASSSTASLTRSATDMGRTRSVSWICRLPRCRRAFASVRPLKPSAGDGDARSGGSVAWTRRQEPDQRADLAVEREECVGVTRPPRPQLRRGPSRVAPQREGRPVDGRGEGDHVGLDGSKAVRAEPKVSDDTRTKTSQAVGGNRRPHARGDLLRRQCAARPAAAFENECAQPGLRQVARRHQAVVAGADDDRVVSLPGHESSGRPAVPKRAHDLEGGETARRPHDPSSGVRGRAAHPEVS